MAQFIRLKLDGKPVYINVDQIVRIEDKSEIGVDECEIYFTDGSHVIQAISADRFWEIHDLDLID